jgi:hypothetical protein
VGSAVENASPAYASTTAAPHEYFDQTGDVGTGFVYKAGVFTEVTVPPDSFVTGTTAYGINNLGQVVGVANVNASMPEPSSVLVFGGGLVVLLLWRRIPS